MASTLLEPPAIPLRASADDPSFTSQCSAESSFRELDDAFLQSQTRIWLGEVLHERFNQEPAVSDLLADGEVLFAVSERIWGMLLDSTMDLSLINVVERKSVASGNSAARYMKYSKVDTFLQICKSVGLAGIDLFTPSDVVEKKNTRKVCMCIRSLSKKARAKNLDVPDFDIVTCTVAMPTNMVGFMRRSWELAQYSSSASSSSSHDVEKNSRTRSGQRKSGATSARSNDSCSDITDDTGSDLAESHTRILNYSSDATSQLNTESPMMKKYSPTHVASESMSEDAERDVIPGENMSPYLCESVGSPFSQHDSSDCHLVDSMTPPLPFLGSRVSGKVYRMKKTDARSYEDGMLNPVSVHLDWEDSTCAHEGSGDSIEEDDNHISNGKGDLDLSCIEADCSDMHALAGAGDTFRSEIVVGSLTFDSPASIVRQGRSSDDDEEGTDSVNSMSAAGMNAELQGNFSGGTLDHSTDNNLLMHHSNSDSVKPLPDVRIEDNALSEECTSPTADRLSNSNECRDYYLYDDGICISQIYTEVVSVDGSNCDFTKDNSYSRVKQIQGFEAVRYPCNINPDAWDDTCSCTATPVECGETDVHKSIQFLRGGGCDSPQQTDKDALDSSVVESVVCEEDLDDDVLKTAHLVVAEDMPCQDLKDSADTAASIQGSSTSISYSTKDGCECDGSSHHNGPVESCVDICVAGRYSQPLRHQDGAAEGNVVCGENEVCTDHSGAPSREYIEKLGCISDPHLGEPLHSGPEDEGFQVCNDPKDAEGAKEIGHEAETRNSRLDEVKQHQKEQGKMLLKSVMSGTAIAGVMFFLFQLRYTGLINILTSCRKTCSRLINLSSFIKGPCLFDYLWYVNGGMGERKQMKLLLQRLIGRSSRGNHE